jgi:hypothetical protein
MNNYTSNISRYAVIQKDFGLIKIPKISAFFPEPSDDDYMIGYIYRNFVQKVNDSNSPIFEIDNNRISEVSSNDFYSVVTITWRLTGTPQEIMDSNKNSIKLVSDNMKNLKLYLPNLLQFAKV